MSAAHDSLTALRDAVASIARSCGQLDERYSEPEALQLNLLLGKCGPILRTALVVDAKQDALREAIQDYAAGIEKAIRQAVADPTNRQPQDRVVALVAQLRMFVHEAQQRFV